MIVINFDYLRSSSIPIGRQMETGVRQIVFDLSGLINLYGAGTAQLVHQRCQDLAPYIVPAVQEGTELSWTVTNTDTAYKGCGKAEIRWTVNGALAKTITMQTVTRESITGDTAIPAPLQSWYDAMIDYIDENSISEDDLADAVAEYLEAHPVTAPVTSVNGETGDVNLDAEAVGAYALPVGGIPKTDLASAVQTSLGKADSAIQTETDPTVPAWAKAAQKPSYTASEVGALPDDTAIPTKTSDLTNDSGFGTYSKPSGGIPKSDLASAVQTSLGKADSSLQSAPVTSVNGKTGDVTLNASDVGAGTYSKPAGGIPKSDLASAVQVSLGKADSALQSAPVASVNGQTGAVTINVPTKTSDLQNDSGFGTYSKPSTGIPASDLASGVIPTVPSPGSSTPAALGTAAAGSATDYARSDHVHAMPTASQVGAELPTTIVNKTSSDTSQTLAANTFYVWPEMSALTITCPATGGPFAFRFTSGSTATTLTMTGITMPDDFAVEANKVYEVNVYQGYGLAVSWEVTA